MSTSVLVSPASVSDVPLMNGRPSWATTSSLSLALVRAIYLCAPPFHLGHPFIFLAMSTPYCRSLVPGILGACDWAIAVFLAIVVLPFFFLFTLVASVTARRRPAAFEPCFFFLLGGNKPV